MTAPTTDERPRPTRWSPRAEPPVPLACGYYSNPLELARHADELDTAAWARGVRRRGGLEVLQVNLGPAASRWCAAISRRWWRRLTRASSTST